MGLASRAAIAAFLVARGWAGSTPAALLFAAGTPRAHAWTGRLDALGNAPIPEGLEDAPGTIVIGDVVGLAAAVSASAAAGESEEGDAHALSR
jgi:siroheme synthase